jgi:hypothetical protein
MFLELSEMATAEQAINEQNKNDISMQTQLLTIEQMRGYCFTIESPICQ